MTHAVETVAYKGEKLWHGLGEKVADNMTFDDWFNLSGINYNVCEAPVHFTRDGAPMPFKGLKALYRDTDGRPLSVVSDRYRVVQPREILEFYRDLVESSGFALEVAGVLREGKRIWALARTNREFFVGGEDLVKSYLLLATSYDGSFSTTAQFTQRRVACNNMLNMALNDDERSAVRVPHHASFEPEAVKKQLGVSMEQLASHRAALETLARIKLDTAKAAEVMRKVFRVPAEIKNDTQRTNLGHADKITEMFNKRDFIGSDMGVVDGTAWGLVNCTTEYLDYRRRARSDATRMDNAWFGDGAATKVRVVNELLELA